jgi:hypothetical protein
MVAGSGMDRVATRWVSLSSAGDSQMEGMFRADEYGLRDGAGRPADFLDWRNFLVD